MFLVKFCLSGKRITLVCIVYTGTEYVYIFVLLTCLNTATVLTGFVTDELLFLKFCRAEISPWPSIILFG
uniref:Uncharacterized protein n=1 Tax=Meloidogyne enterolobii TaxID=390850 RepID=A0A6V7TYJ3_MELEN|nr:unnamed protein product [Meloidogyne enterolobii]